MYIPPGFGTVTPYIFAQDAQRLVDFLLAGLGGRETCRTMRPDGKVANCQVLIGDTTLMVSEATERFQPSRSAFYLYVADADEAMTSTSGSGSFDDRFLADQIRMHREAIALYRAQASGGSDPDLRQFASDQLPHLEHHLEMLQGSNTQK